MYKLQTYKFNKQQSEYQIQATIMFDSFVSMVNYLKRNNLWLYVISCGKRFINFKTK